MKQSSSEKARARYEARQAARSLLPRPLRYPEDLPISARKDEIVAALGASQVLVVAGETGSGKSTQLPKMCLEAGRGSTGMIGHTQPRRIAARSIARARRRGARGQLRRSGGVQGQVHRQGQ